MPGLASCRGRLWDGRLLLKHGRRRHPAARINRCPRYAELPRLCKLAGSVSNMMGCTQLVQL